jgi:SAM-dependent methyltransferase
MRATLDRLREVIARTMRIDEGSQRQLFEEVSAIRGLVTQASAHGRAANIETALFSAGLAARARRLSSPVPSLSAGGVARPIPYEEALANLEALNPRLFPVWKQLFDNGSRAYYEEKEGSCSHNTHYHAKLFGAYCEIYAQGRVLDVGCGPHGVPSYLATWNRAQSAGLEPLVPSTEPDFELQRGFNEFLPWTDDSFDTVLSATSLDHVLSLDRSLAEVRRVLKPSGRYLIWLASIAGAPAFDPNKEAFEPIDQFHLFHFDRVWIEPLFEAHFEIEDVTIVPQPGFDHVFYAMRPR